MEGGAGLIGSGMRMQLDQRSIKGRPSTVPLDSGRSACTSLTLRIAISLQTGTADDRRVYFPGMDRKKAGLK
ncbi:hypothetical protein BV25DRAFT_1823743 [Artomyces pyxidatus]|uniref:Uncharacterized protein n=1 Tax=Artomyces pyxidatus TaxID=48021 RepID=A0ACB8T6N6_9AGAM|nr:hypothetical protein BV25DRAFT_1823743 [Artomyces pyxidatus]